MSFAVLEPAQQLVAGGTQRQRQPARQQLSSSQSHRARLLRVGG